MNPRTVRTKPSLIKDPIQNLIDAKIVSSASGVKGNLKIELILKYSPQYGYPWWVKTTLSSRFLMRWWYEGSDNSCFTTERRARRFFDSLVKTHSLKVEKEASP